MIEQVKLETKRLLLRPFRMEDAGDVQKLAGDPAIAKTTLNVPHPYENGMAEKWIGSHGEALKQGRNIVYAIVDRENGRLLGAISCALSQQHGTGELGYWIGRPFWSHGYCTEAGLAVIDFCFETIGLVRIHAHHLAGNPASGRVLQKLGMQREGCLRQHVRKDGHRYDVLLYGILRAPQTTLSPRCSTV